MQAERLCICGKEILCGLRFGLGQTILTTLGCMIADFLWCGCRKRLPSRIGKKRVFSWRVARDGGAGGESSDGEGGREEGGAYEGGKSTRSGNRRAQQSASLSGRVPEDLQHLLPQEHQNSSRIRTEAT